MTNATGVPGQLIELKNYCERSIELITADSRVRVRPLFIRVFGHLWMTRRGNVARVGDRPAGDCADHEQHARRSDPARLLFGIADDQ